MPRWDVFCRVVDNFGDIGVCWRLARTLVREHAAAVRLWVDDLHSLRALCPATDVDRSVQTLEGIDVRHWVAVLPEVEPADMVIEAFGCGLPESYVVAMADRAPQPVWIVLEYLSAEPWVGDFHARPSPHPRYPLERSFFFPGFDVATGGLLRERDLLTHRDAFSAADRDQFWRELGFAPPRPEAMVVSMFGYDSAPIVPLVEAIEHSTEATVLAVPAGAIEAAMRQSFGLDRSATRVQRGRLEIRLLPFVEQARYDELLWAADLNFVRGEDSFVRAQWAARPFVWQIYPQAENAHTIKLKAFLDRYLAGVEPGLDRAVRDFWQQWNGSGGGASTFEATWGRFSAARSALSGHARVWAARLSESDTLANRLAKFAQERLK
jgi:uncharacterized repeat protein (TIGR03837 family)